MDVTKIIKATAVRGRTSTAASVIKEDHGLYLLIGGIDLPEVYEVDFSNEEHAGTSVTMVGNADGVLIPTQFIKSGKDVFAFYYHVGEDFGRTLYTIRIPNKLRPDRTDIQPTPAEQSTIDQLIGALNSAVEQTGEDVESAEQAKDDAESARDNAQTYANNAQSSAQASARSAESASQSASQASTSATASAESASASAQIKADVEDLVDDAQSYAESALIASQASVTARNTAQGYAQSASASAQSASTSASNASTSANTASTKASEASTSASTASTKASESAQNASQALSYKTDAESAKTASQTAQGLAESARDTAVSAKDDAESARDDAESARDEAQQAVASISGALDDKAPVITDTASGSIASFSDGADDLPLKSLVVDINPIQDLSHGDPSPENICPISGWTSINVNHSDADTTNPTTLTIQLGQTVYGGKLDVVTGELVIDRAGNIYDGSDDEDWQVNGVGGGLCAMTITDNTTVNVSANTDTNINVQSDRLQGQSANDIVYNRTVYKVGIITNHRFMVTVKDTDATGITGFKSWLASNPTTVCYKLATPITYQLTPNQINSLYGVNNLWADSGDTTCVYRADTKLFIERLTAPDSADMIADANITSGKYFMVGNNLFKATANIANGSAIVVGTNCIRKSLSEALNEINA